MAMVQDNWGYQLVIKSFYQGRYVPHTYFDDSSLVNKVCNKNTSEV